jgi:hypothetical protein
MLGSKTHKRDRVRCRNKRVGHHAPVTKREPRDCVTVDEREQHRALELAGVIEGGKPPDDPSVVVLGEPQLDAGRTPLAQVPGLRRPAGRAAQISDAFLGNYAIDGGIH